MAIEKFCQFVDVLRRLHLSPMGLSYTEINRLTGNKNPRSAKRVLQAIEDVFMVEIEQVRDTENHRIKRFRLPQLDLRLLARFTADELVEINTAIQLCHNNHHPAAGEALAKIQDKLKLVMQNRVSVESDLQYMAYSELAAPAPGPKSRIDPEIFQRLRHAIVAETVINLEYRKVYTEPRQSYQLHPYGIVYGKRHYLVAYSPEKDAIRMYALSHCLSLQLTDESFVRPENFNLGEYMADSFGVFVCQPEDVILRFSPEARNDVLQFDFHKSQQIIDQPDGQVEIRLHCCGFRELCYHLFTWGEHVKIVSPVSLKKQYAQMLKKAQMAVQ